MRIVKPTKDELKLDTLEDFANVHHKIWAESQRRGRDLALDALKVFFEEAPRVYMVGWTQYTPYFNDGDACVFSVHDIHILTFNDYREYREDLDEDDDFYPENYIWDWPCVWSMGQGWMGEHPNRERVWREEWADIGPALEKLEECFQTADSVLEAAFGDHSQIFATRENVRVEEYQHD